MQLYIKNCKITIFGFTVILLTSAKVRIHIKADTLCISTFSLMDIFGPKICMIRWLYYNCYHYRVMVSSYLAVCHKNLLKKWPLPGLFRKDILISSRSIYFKFEIVKDKSNLYAYRYFNTKQTLSIFVYKVASSI